MLVYIFPYVFVNSVYLLLGEGSCYMNYFVKKMSSQIAIFKT